MKSKQWEGISSIVTHLKNLKKEQLLILLLAGVLLFVISLPVSNGKTEEKKGADSSFERNTVSAQQPSQSQNQQYAECMEEKLRETLMQVAGVGKVQVMITLTSTAETIVEKDVPNTRNSSSETDSAGGTRTSMELSSTEETVYMTDGEGRQVPYVRKEIEPQIQGVVIVAEGGNNPVVAASITEAAQALFQVEAHKIKVMKMKNQN